MDKKVNRIIIEYKDKLKRLGVIPKRIILYGSYALGKAKRESDIDLVVVSDDFKDMDLWERLCLLGQARIGIKKPMEIQGFTEKEFETEPFIKDEVKTKGIEVI